MWVAADLESMTVFLICHLEIMCVVLRYYQYIVQVFYEINIYKKLQEYTGTDF